MLFGTLEKHEKCLHGKQIAVTRRRRPPPAAYAFSADMVKIKQQHLHHAPFLFGQRFFSFFSVWVGQQLPFAIENRHGAGLWDVSCDI